MLEVTSEAQLIQELHELREQLKPTQVRFADAMLARGPARVRDVADAIGISSTSAVRWWALPEVRAYVAKALELEAADLVVSRSRVVGEMAAIGMSDIGTVLLHVKAARRRIEDRRADDDSLNLEGALEDSSAKVGCLTRAAEDMELSVLSELPASVSRVIKRVRFNTVRERRYGADGKKIAEIPVPVLSEFELHDKVRALSTLGTWYNLDREVTPDTPEAEGGEVSGWQGNTIVAPIVREKADE